MCGWTLAIGLSLSFDTGTNKQTRKERLEMKRIFIYFFPPLFPRMINKGHYFQLRIFFISHLSSLPLLPCILPELLDCIFCLRLWHRHLHVVQQQKGGLLFYPKTQFTGPAIHEDGEITVTAGR